MRPHIVIIPAFAAIGLATTVMAATPTNSLQHYRGIEFVCTGIGQDQRDDQRWNRYPLKLEFTNRDGDYLGDVQVRVKNGDGTTVLEAHCQAPWLIADLKAGAYTATVMAEGAMQKTIDFEVKSGDKQTRVVVSFSDQSGT